MVDRIWLFLRVFILVLGIVTISAKGSDALPANNCAGALSSDLSIHVPILDLNGQYFWVDFQYIPDTLNFDLTNAGVVTDLSPFDDCTDSTLSSSLLLHIDSLPLNGISYWADLQYSSGLTFTMIGAGENSPVMSYFPTSVGTTWTFKDLNNGKLYTRTVISSGDHPEIKTVKPDGSYYIKSFVLLNNALYLSTFNSYDKNGKLSPFASNTYSPARLYLPSSIEAGTHDTAQTSLNGLNRTIDITVTDVGTSTVLAGTFQNSILITENETFISSSTGNPTTNTVMRWLAPGVGIIMEKYLSLGSEELTTYSVK